jgi:hypothetical protein
MPISAFRASKIANQTIPAGAPSPIPPASPTLITFTNEIFDRNLEYDGESTFTAKQDGVYQFSVSLFLTTGNNAIIDLYIVVDNNISHPQTSVVRELISSSNNAKSVDLTTIIELKTNQTVNVYVNISTGGTANGSPPPGFSNYSHFEGARFPS